MLPTITESTTTRLPLASKRGLDEDNDRLEEIACDLIDTHYTHREAMDGSTILQQHDNLQKQISAFDKLLQHAVNKFSSEKLCHMLKAIVKICQTSRASQTSIFISCLSDLKQLQEEFNSKGDELPKGIQKDELSYVSKYFTAFFDDIEYFKKLKKNFDEKIYMCLYDYFYDPEDDVDGQFNIVERNNEEASLSEMDTDDESSVTHVSARSLDTALPHPHTDTVVYGDLSDKEKLSHAVRELYRMNQTWDKLFDEDVLDARLFDGDSLYELAQLQDYSHVENVLRLVPDIIVKAFKSLELAKLWWTQANKVYDSLPIKRNSAVEFNKKVERLEKDIAKLRLEVMRDSDVISQLMRELERLKEREAHYDRLSEACEQAEKEQNRLGQHYNYVLLTSEALRLKRDKLSRHSPEYGEIIREITACNKQMVEAKRQVDMMEYQMRLLREDFECALRVRPDMIYFSADLTEKIQSIEKVLKEKKTLKRTTEKKLVLLRTNCDRMRQIMRKYIKSVTVRSQQPASGHARLRAGGDGRRVRDEVVNGARQSPDNADHEGWRTPSSPLTGGESEEESSQSMPSSLDKREKNMTFITGNQSESSSVINLTRTANSTADSEQEISDEHDGASASRSGSSGHDGSLHDSEPKSQTSCLKEDTYNNENISSKRKPRVYSRKLPFAKSNHNTRRNRRELPSNSQIPARSQRDQQNSSESQSDKQNPDESKSDTLSATENDGNDADVEGSPKHSRSTRKKVSRRSTSEGFTPQNHVTNDSILNRKPFPKGISRIPQRSTAKQAVH